MTDELKLTDPDELLDEEYAGWKCGLNDAIKIVESEPEYPNFEKEILAGLKDDEWEERFRSYPISRIVLAVTKMVSEDMKNSIADRLKQHLRTQ